MFAIDELTRHWWVTVVARDRADQLIIAGRKTILRPSQTKDRDIN